MALRNVVAKWWWVLVAMALAGVLLVLIVQKERFSLDLDTKP